MSETAAPRFKPSASELAIVARLRAGDESAFRDVVADYHPGMIRLAEAFVRTRATAEEVAQEAWLALLEGIAGFEGRSTIRSWLLSIVANKAKSRAQRDKRIVPFADMARADGESQDDYGPADLSDLSQAGPLTPWNELDPERIVSGKQLWRHAVAFIEALPELQRAVVVLRDVQGCDADETCAILDISGANQRVLLHRARAKLRDAFDRLISGPAEIEHVKPHEEQKDRS